MANPFANYGKIVGGERLVGREPQISQLVKRLCGSKGSYSVVGEPRIGKSSLVHEVFNRVSAEKPNSPVVRFVTSTIDNPQEIFSEILEGSLSQLRRSQLPIPQALDPIVASAKDTVYNSYVRCRDGLQELYAAGIEVFAIVEEFDAIRRIENVETAISGLRELLYQPDEFGLSAVIVSRRSLRVIEKQIRGISILDGVCEKIYLRPLAREGLEEMAQRSRRKKLYSQEALETLWEYSGGHPWIAEMILCRSWDLGNIHDGIEHSVSEIHEHYEHLQEILAEEAMFEQLVQVAVGPRWDLKPGAIEWLRRYGLIITNGENGHYEGWSNHFQAYLEHCTRQTPVWELWGATESALRSAISDVCQSRFGDDWMGALAKAHKSVALIRDGCLERRQKEKTRFGPAASDELLDYSYPMDLWSIISAEWRSSFQEFFKRTKPYWRSRFELLAKVRTPAAHNRPIAPADITTANGYCQELLTQLRNPAG